jgi:hypothetical protein
MAVGWQTVDCSSQSRAAMMFTIWPSRSDGRAHFGRGACAGLLSEIRQGIAGPSTNHSAPDSQSCLPARPQNDSFALTTRRTLEATQLLDAGQSALQSRSVATIHLISLLPAVCFFQFARPTAAGNWLARPRACSPPHNPRRAPPHLLSLS